MAIPTHIDVVAAIGNRVANVPTNYNGGYTDYIVETPLGVNYLFYIDANHDPAFCKSLDGGMTWGTGTVLKNCTTTQIAIWYQRWTDLTGVLGDKIWAAYTDSGVSDVFIRSIDTANSDALGTEYTVFAGASTAAGGALSICQMIGGNLMAVGCIDAGTEVFSRKSVDSGANWTNISAGYEANGDQCICLPGWGADTQDGMMFYWDNSASAVTVKYYDDSGDSWAESAIATSIAFGVTTDRLGSWGASVEHANSRNVLVFWTAIDAANADLRCFYCTQSAQTETAANVVLNSTDDQGFTKICISSDGKWNVFYCGSSDGAEYFNPYIRVYYKTSSDSGTNWSAEALFSNIFDACAHMKTKPISYRTIGVATHKSSEINVWHYHTSLAIPHSTFQLGM